MCTTCTVAHADNPRVSVAYTAWDDYFFYAGFEVNDHNVISRNRTPVSQPQEDDDVEVFINTNSSQSATVRTPSTYQMAVSAGSGSYFSVGDGTKIPKGKLVLTYKYAVTIDGTLNDSTDNDTGFTVELAIPWQELGMTGPPSSGQIFGFNAISRNREDMDIPAQSFVSLSPDVVNRDDIQNPSKWSKIQFITTLASQKSGPNMVYCPRVTSDTNYPVIDGVIRSGEWATNFGFSFGDTPIAGVAPTKSEEPNIAESPFSTLQLPVIQTPKVSEQAAAPTAPGTGGKPDYTIALPGGGEIHVGPMKPLPPPPILPTEQTEPGGHHKFMKYPGSDTDPLAPNLPPGIDSQNDIGPAIDPDATLSLVPQKEVAPLIVAPFKYLFPNSGTQLIDQPINGFGPAFGGSDAQWDKDQLVDARRSGIDVLLPIVDSANPAAERGLATLVEALKELKQSGQDYPLLGVKVVGKTPIESVREFLEIVPREFRAEVILPDSMLSERAYIVYADTVPDISAIKKVVATDSGNSDTVLVTSGAGTDYLKIVTVSPGGTDSDGKLVGRHVTQTLSASWDQVYTGNPNWVYIDSWNDYVNGTEVAASRQYGEQYADYTKAAALKWAGADQWDAKYLQNDVPSIIAQKTIYTVSVRVENNGSLPWRAGEGYALCYRWYKDGRLYDDSAPRLPLSNDIYPGDSATIKVGVVAQNSFGKDIEPGRYTLVFDMVQGKSRWFSYVGSRPLRVPVRVENTVDAPQSLAVVIGSTTPALLEPKASYQVSLFIRNEGQENWNETNSAITLTGSKSSAHGTFSSVVYPGAVGQVTLTISLPPDTAPGTCVPLIWNIKTPGSTTTWTERSYTIEHDLGVSFAENSIPRIMKTNESNDAKLALINLGPQSWIKQSWKIGAQWLSLDGRPASKEKVVGSLDDSTYALTESTASVSITAPSDPGKYQLVVDLHSPDGITSRDSNANRGTAFLSMIVTVVPGKNSSAEPVDLSKYFTLNGEGYETTTDSANFDGKGEYLPASFMPPDGTQELDVNPLLVGKPGPALYPSGYYSEPAASDDIEPNRISFLYGPKDGKNTVVCSGQQIDCPDGNWKTVHLLAASTGKTSEEPCQILIDYHDTPEQKNIKIANWTKVPAPASATIGLRLPYGLLSGEIVSDSPLFLGDYAVPVDSSRHFDHITLPNDPDIKVLAITLER